MSLPRARCLILACGNTLRGDDSLGPWLAQWAERRFQPESGVRVLARQQWAPELAEEVARAQSVLFIDCSIDSPPGSVRLLPVEPAVAQEGLATHHLGAPELLALGRELYNSLPCNAFLLTVGAGSTALGEDFSAAVTAALPEACDRLEATVSRLLSGQEPQEQPQHP
ncbi:MAG: hydrogenase maturation protease [Terracidiphilus sp.]|jgi:hydrogenase maturation protease